jgi:hypothetical protein
LLGVTSTIIPWFILTCLGCIYVRSRRRDEDDRRGREANDRPANDYGDWATLVVAFKTITEDERRKTLLHCFQRNQVTMVRICLWHFPMGYGMSSCILKSHILINATVFPIYRK